MARKLRGTHGERNHHAVLTEVAVRDILASPEPGSTLARLHGVSPSTICDIRKGRSWRYLHPDYGKATA